MGEQEKRPYAVQSVESALDVLEALTECTDGIGITRLSERLSLSKAKVFRLLATFERRGYVEKEKRTGRYRLGTSAFETGQKFLLSLALLQKSKTVMESLAWKCNEAVYLGLRRGMEVLLLDMVDTLQQVKVVPLLGRRYPLEKVAAGAVLLAAMTTAESAQASDPWNGTRHLGFARDCSALGEGISSLAVPLWNGAGEVVGSLSLVGPSFRFEETRMEQELLPLLRQAGEIISSRSGYPGKPGHVPGNLPSLDLSSEKRSGIFLEA